VHFSHVLMANSSLADIFGTLTVWFRYLRSMFTPRFQLNDPNEPSNSFKNLNLIPRCLQDPLFLTVKNPTPAQQNTLLQQAGAVVHHGVFDMIATALKNGTELDRNFLSIIAETGKVIIEEATSLVWNEGGPELSRYVVIKRLSPDDSETEYLNESEEEFFSGDLFQLTIEISKKGEVEATLGWENGDCVESHESLISRWQKIDSVFRELKTEPPGFDLLPYAVAHSDTRNDDEYNVNGITLVCYAVEADVIVQDLDREGWASQNDPDDDDDERSHDDDEDQEDEFGLFSSSQADVEGKELSLSDLHAPSARGYLSEDEASGDTQSSAPFPGEDLTIIEPTPGQLSTIAKLSSITIPRKLAGQLLEMTRTKAPVRPEDFDYLESGIREPLAIHRRVTYTLEGSFSEAHRYSIDECEFNKPTMFSIDLFHQPALTRDSSDLVKSVLHWEIFSADADIPNWDRIVKAAKDRRP
jgi:hypothetical protein